VKSHMRGGWLVALFLTVRSVSSPPCQKKAQGKKGESVINPERGKRGKATRQSNQDRGEKKSASREERARKRTRRSPPFCRPVQRLKSAEEGKTLPKGIWERITVTVNF